MKGVVVNIEILDFSIIVFVVSIALNLTVHFVFPKHYSPFWITMIAVPIGATVYIAITISGLHSAIIYVAIYSTIPCFIANVFTTLIVEKILKEVG